MLPATWSERVGAKSGWVTLAGRKLATWTGFRGLDPEVTSQGQARARATADLFVPPLARTFWLRLDAQW